MPVRTAQAGCIVTCSCGEQNRVPSLRELKEHETLGTDVTAVSPPATKFAPRTETRPIENYIHCCGEVGVNGNVSNFAMTQYVELVSTLIRKFIAAIDSPLFSDLLISIAMGPNGDQRIEWDILPGNCVVPDGDTFVKLIKKVKTPPVHGSPVAFAIYHRTASATNSNQPIAVFPSLSGMLAVAGVEGALRQTFGMPPRTSDPVGGVNQAADVTPSRSWWSRFVRLLPFRSSAVDLARTDQSIQFSYEHWIAELESKIDGYAFDEIKRAVIDQPDRAEYRALLALKFAEQQEWDQAIVEYGAVISMLDDCVPALYRRARLLRETGNTASALADCNAAIDIVGDDPRLFHARSSIYCELGAWDQALRDLNDAIELAPREPDFFYSRGQLHLQVGHQDEAKTDFREATHWDPNFGHAHLRCGWLQYCLDRTQVDVAIAHLTRATELLVDDPTAHLHRCLIYLSENKFVLAMQDCDEVLDRHPENPAAHGLRGRVLQCEGEFEEAIRECTRSLELGYEDASIYLARSISYAATDQPTLALHDCDAALNLEPQNAWAIQFRGKLSMQAGDLDAAMEAFRRASELAPQWAEPREHVSLVHRMNEDPQAAVREQNELIENQPTHAAHYVNRAFSYTQLEDFVAAADDYDRAVELDPENDEIYFLRGIFRMERQEDELALADLDRVLLLRGDDDETRSRRALVLLRLRRNEEAAEDYAKLIQRHPDNPAAYNGRVFAFSSMGENDLAEADIERLDQLVPENAENTRLNQQIANTQRLLLNEEYDDALQAAVEIVIEHPDESIGYRLRAHIRWEREEYVEACDDYGHVIEMVGPTADTLSARGQVQAELGEWENAIVDLNEAVDLARRAGQMMVLAYALNGRSLTLAGLNRDDESMRDYEESVSLCPTNPWVYYHQGMRRFRLNEPAQARVLLELALEFNDPPLSQRKKQRAELVLRKLKVSN